MRMIEFTRPRLIAIAVVVALVLGLIGTRAISERIAERKRRMAFESLNATAMTRIAELGVLKYRYTDVMELSRKFPVGGGSTSLVRFSGLVKAGIADATKISCRFDPDANTVKIALPHAAIIDNTVDVSTVKIWDVRRNIFVPITTELKLQEIAAFKEKVARELETSGFLTEADSRAEELVSSLYAGFGAKIIITR